MERLIKCIINQALISHIRNRAALDIWIQWKYRPYKVRITNVCRIYGQIGDNGTQNYLAFRLMVELRRKPSTVMQTIW